MFLFIAFGATHIANLPKGGGNSSTETGAVVDTANVTFIATAFGLSLITNMWVLFRVSGALFNPAITLALMLVKVIPPYRAALFILSQILGGITAAALVDVLVPDTLNVSTRLGGGITIAQGKLLASCVCANA